MRIIGVKARYFSSLVRSRDVENGEKRRRKELKYTICIRRLQVSVFPFGGKKMREGGKRKLTQVTPFPCPNRNLRSSIQAPLRPSLPFKPLIYNLCTPPNVRPKDKRQVDTQTAFNQMYNLFFSHKPSLLPCARHKSNRYSLVHHHRWAFNLPPFMARRPGSETKGSARNPNLPIPHAARQLRP